MSGVNKVFIIGNLGRDPEAFNGGCGFSVATSEHWKDKDTGEKKERTEWHNISAFGKTGDNVLQYLKKGSKVFVEGKIQTDKYEKDGVTHYATKIIARDIQFLDSRQQEGGGQGRQDSAPPADDDFDEDIPFN